jgi:hypothetical protein
MYESCGRRGGVEDVLLSTISELPCQLVRVGTLGSRQLVIPFPLFRLRSYLR